MDTLTSELVQHVNDVLGAGEPNNISFDAFGGYTGYKPQYIIDALNDVLGFGGWGFDELSSEIAGQGDKGLVIAQVRVWVKGVDFRPTSWGQARITKGDIGDARKGAQTDAIKKGLSYFSIGNRAYQGLLPKPEEAGQRRPQATNAQRPPASAQATNAQPQSQRRPAPVVAVPPGPSLAEVQALVVDVYGPGKFQSVVKKLVGDVAPEALTPTNLRYIQGKVSGVKAQRAQPVAVND